MTFNWKPPAVAAGGAFLLSLLVGIFGRVGFGTILLRALLWAVIFGGLAYGIDYLLRRFIPELFEAKGDVTVNGERSVDITLDAENPLADDTKTPEAMSEEPPVEAESAASATENSVASEAASADAGAAGDPFDDEDTEEVAELEEVGEPEEIQTENASGEEPAAGSEGDLPNLDGMETAFTTSESDDADGEQPAESIDVLGIDEDPATVARAVRTFMNKDQEG